jgi:hypothetical protein
MSDWDALFHAVRTRLTQQVGHAAAIESRTGVFECVVARSGASRRAAFRVELARSAPTRRVLDRKGLEASACDGYREDRRSCTSGARLKRHSGGNRTA